jgi:putative hydroxymethylpyrimidine transport system ATP-binding protein
MNNPFIGQGHQSNPNAQLVFENVSFTYDKHDKTQGLIINNLSFTILAGEFVSVVGPSGSGKSTLFRLITGLEEPLKGKIYFPNWHSEGNQGEIHSTKPKVGYMPQHDLLLPWRTALDNAILPLEIKGLPKKEAYAQVQPLFQEFGLSGTESLYPHQMSGGMRQRVSFLRAVIASATLNGPPLILLDEPFSALDAITRIAMQEWLLEQWMKRKQTILLITHDVDEALFLSDRIFLVEDQPITQLTEINVPLDRPRRLKDLERREIVQLKYALLTKIKARVRT